MPRSIPGKSCQEVRLIMRMREQSRRAAVVAAFGLSLLGPSLGVCQADDEPRGLGRLFRLGAKPAAGSGSQPNTPSPDPKPATDIPDAGAPAPTPSPFSTAGSRPGRSVAPPVDPYPALNSTGSGSPYGAAGRNPYGGTGGATPSITSATSTSAGAGNSAGPRLVPQPRVSKAVTEAPPLLTRIQLGRSDDGHTFGMFLQIYADGTVIDTEGVHKVGPDVMKPLVETLRASDVGRIKGHCGGPPVDFIQQVMMTVYDVNRGRLQANTFSFSGNPSGCDPSIAKIQAALDAVQAKISPASVAPVTNPEGSPPLTVPSSASTVIPKGDDTPPPLPTLGSPATPSPSIPALEALPNG